MSEEFIVDCTFNRPEERREVFKWLVETRNYCKTYLNEFNYRVIVCNKEDGSSYYNDLSEAIRKFPNHKVYTFEQFKNKINKKK